MFENIASSAGEWIGQNGPELLTKIIISLIILLVAKVAITTAKSLLQTGLEKSGKLNDLLRHFVVNLVGKILWIITWLLVADQFMSIGPLIAGLGVAGFVFGFAFQESLGNFAAGLMILANDPFKAGEYVEAGGHAGTVKEVNIMATVLATPDNRKITIPNGVVWGAPIVNYTTTGTRRVDMTVGVSYGADLTKTREVLMGVLREDPRVLPEPAPLVEVLEMADSSVNFVVRPWAKTADYWGLYWSCQQKIKEALDREGIEIPFPQRVVHLQKPE